jgi:CheY-like chemotaxis protein
MENTVQSTDPELSGTSPVRGSRVLVVAPESEVRWGHVAVLRDAGARVSEARDGIEALDLARQSRPDLVVTAAELPKLAGTELRTALRRDPDLGAIPVILLGDTLPPTDNSNPRERALADAVAALLEAKRLESDEPLEPPDAAPDREDLRAQSTVAMYRQPANRAPRASHPVWRLRAQAGRAEGRAVSGFDSELRVMSRILGAGFIALVVAVLALIGWQLAAEVPTERAPEPDVAPADSADEPLAGEPDAPATSEEPRGSVIGLHEFSGKLRPGLDTELAVGPGQGLLELSGPPEVSVIVDGIDRGALPIQLVLDQGRHVVRYEYDGRRSVRFYFVKAGATRALEVITRPGGFVDAH